MNKKNRLIIGICLLVLVCVIGFYEYRLSEFRGIENVTAYQVKKDVVILKGQELNQSLYETVEYDKNKLPSDYVKTLAELQDKVAVENLYPGDIITQKRIIPKKDFFQPNERYVALSASDPKKFAGNEIRPGDNIDIFLYDKESAGYVLQPKFSDIEVLDVKNKDNISYGDYKSNDFFIENIYFKMTNDDYKSLMDTLAQNNNNFVITIHGNRPQQGVKEPETKGIIEIR